MRPSETPSTVTPTPALKSQPVAVDSNAAGVKCIGGSPALGHPEVFYTFDGRSDVTCHYCGQVFRKG